MHSHGVSAELSGRLFFQLLCTIWDIRRGFGLICAGVDLAQARQMTASSQQPIEPLRFFAGEAQWVSNQLEAELAQGKWMLLAPNAELLHRIALHPQSFDPE